MINNVLKSSVALLVALSVASCSVVNNNGFDANGSQQNMTQVKSKATIVLPLKEILNSFSKSFSVKKYDFNDSKVYQTRIAVYDANSATPEIEKFIKKTDNISNYPISVISGNKLVVLENLEDRKDSLGNDIVLSRLMSTIAIDAGSTTTLKMNYGTIPEAKVLKALIESNVAISSLVKLSDLTTLVNKITGYDEKSNTYGGINPSYVDVDSIVNQITTNYNYNIANPLTPVSLVPVYQRGLFDTEIKGKLRITVRTGPFLSDTIIKPSTLEINDLTATNVSSTVDDTTIIDNVSQGTHILRVKTYHNGKTLYKEISIPINATNTNSINNQTIDLTVVPDQIFVGSVVLDQIENNKDLIVPAGGGITLTVNESQSSTIKAKVIMTDGTINQNYQLKTSDSTIVSAGGNSISGIKLGSAIITIESNDKDALGNKVSITFNVNVVKKDNTAVTGIIPYISSFSPTYVAPTLTVDTGTTIIIKGDNFDNSSNVANTISFNGIDGTVITTNPYDITKTQIKVRVPVGATTGRISVATAKGTVVTNAYLIIGAATINPLTTAPFPPSVVTVDTSGMVYIKGSEFYEGFNGATDDTFYPRHKVVLNDFYMDKNEITNAQFKAFIDAGGYTTQSFWSVDGWAWVTSNVPAIVAPSYWDDTRFNQDQQPVVGVSYYEAEAYANFLGKRLPTEAEWEFAAKGSKDDRAYPWGGGAPGTGNKLANGYFGDYGKTDGYQYTAPVSSFTGDESPFGLKDMSGNAAEWVSDWYDARYYSNAEASNPKGPTIGGTKSVRGGSWYNHPYYKNDFTKLVDSLKTYTRFYSAPTNRSNYIGFRTVAATK